MDASDGANTNGNGHADPEPVSLPSAAAAPSGAPVSGAIAAPAAGAPEPLIVVDDDVRDEHGRIRKGKTLNPKGRAPGIPNKNTEFLKLLTSTQLREVWAIAKKLALKGDVGLLEFLLERALVKLTPEAAGIVINNNPSAHASAGASATASTLNDRLEELRGDPGVRDSFCDLVDRIAERRAAKSVSPRN